MLIHLINDRSLSLSTLKVIEYAEMDKVKLKFLKDVLTGILMQENEENVQEIFLKIATSEKLSVFRESLRLFLCHFMVQKSIQTSDGETITCNLNDEEMDQLKERIKVAENILLVGKGRVLL
jgi:nucleolar MIF4G domain-containing protein 1